MLSDYSVTIYAILTTCKLFKSNIFLNMLISSLHTTLPHLLARCLALDNQSKNELDTYVNKCFSLRKDM